MDRRSFLATSTATALSMATAQAVEEIIDPDLPIIDPHHHLWDLPGSHYLLPEVLRDVSSGHNIVRTVFVECNSMYRASGPLKLRSLGETEFVNGVAAMSASDRYGKVRIAAGIVGAVDLQSGAAVRSVLERHVAAAGARFRGIRVQSAWDPDPLFGGPMDPKRQALLADRKFRQGFAQLAPMGLSFDAWCFHTQIADIDNLARAFPGTRIVLDHVASPLGVGPYASRREEILAGWRSAMAGLRPHQNVYIKLGGLGMITFGSPHYKQRPAATAAVLAAEWRPYIEYCIEQFGVQRCMFESNFPVDADTCDYRTLWNAFKHITLNYSAAEKAELYHDTARRAYRLPAASP
jgi:predicted TIM-barrel fold metal-dependent hydrolase